MARKNRETMTHEGLVMLRKGESYREYDKYYSYRFTDSDGERHEYYAKTLAELHNLERRLKTREEMMGELDWELATINDMYDIWAETKRGIRKTTRDNYIYMYKKYVSDGFGKTRVAELKRTNVKRFYIKLVEDKCLKESTLDNIQNVLHQVLDIAVDEMLIVKNPSNYVLRGLKREYLLKTAPKEALTEKQQRTFLEYCKNSRLHKRWYPLFAVMFYTGMRVGEVTGLQWDDYDLKRGVFRVNKSLVGEKKVKGENLRMNPPKTFASTRVIPIFPVAKEAMEMEKKKHIVEGLKCATSIDGYSNFIFLNRFGNPCTQQNVNDAIHRICCEYNLQAEEEGRKDHLPYFTSHSIRHTFATRLCEKNVNVKIIQEWMGHRDIQTTMDIYVQVTGERRQYVINHLPELD